MPTFKIEVPTVITRIYTVTADSEEQALDLYHNGDYRVTPDLTFDEDDSSNAYEMEYEAKVEEI